MATEGGVRTIAELPFFASGRFPKPDLVGTCRGGQLTLTSGRELLERVRDISLGISSLGVKPGDRIALLSESRPEWLMIDLAVLTAGAVVVPIYPTLSAAQTRFILQDSGATVAIVSNATQLEKLLSSAADLPSLRKAVVIDSHDAAIPSGSSVELHAFGDVVAAGHRRILDGWGVAREFHDAATRVMPGDLATIVYTSGTTGDPRGVCLTHGNLVANIEGVQQVLDLHEGDTALSFLPLCHAFERIVSYVYLACGVSVAFAESFDTVARDLKLVRPTVMSGVPRAFEKMHARVFERGRELTGMKRVLFDRAMAVADARGEALLAGRPLSLRWRLEASVADRFVFPIVREAIGGRGRFFVSGSAPLREDTTRFFLGAGLPLLEGYGLTEAGPVVSVTPLGRVKKGSVGPPLPNVSVRIADDGEILVKSAGVMAGYHGRKAETDAVIADGWLHTGDIGSLDADGYLRVTDRKKELLLTSGGKKVAPQPIEAALRVNPLVVDAMLVGDGRRFISALVVPRIAAVAAALKLQPPTTDAGIEAWLARPDVRALFEGVIATANAPLAPFERIKQFAIVSKDFGADPSAITPTLKVKRRVIEQTHRTIIDSLYV